MYLHEMYSVSKYKSMQIRRGRCGRSGHSVKSCGPLWSQCIYTKCIVFQKYKSMHIRRGRSGHSVKSCGRLWSQCIYTKCTVFQSISQCLFAVVFVVAVATVLNHVVDCGLNVFTRNVQCIKV